MPTHHSTPTSIRTHVGLTWRWLDALDDVCLLRAADLRQVIRAHKRILGFDVPHAESHLIARSELTRIVEHEGLYIELPDEIDPVLLVAAPSANDRAVLPDWVLERRTLAAVLHIRAEARLLAYFESSQAEGSEATDREVAELLDELGDAAVREARRVLLELDRLDEDPSDTEVLVEILATALTLRHTTGGHLALWFPTLDPTRLDAVVARLDLDLTIESLLGDDGALRAPALAGRTVPAGGSSPQIKTADTGKTELEQLALRLSAALAHLDLTGVDWSSALFCLRLPTSGRRQARARRRLRRELVVAARAIERPGLRFRPLRFVRSLGRQGLFDRLEEQPHVRLHRALVRAHSQAHLLAPASNDLSAGLERAIEAQRRAIHDRLGPLLAETIRSSGLAPGNVPEEVAADGIVTELLDNVTESHYLGFGDLRDAISRSQLKLRDVTPGSLVLGDALLAADRRLASRLPGVYRKSTVYMRAIQRSSSLFFGTMPGRLLTRFILLPFLTSFVALEGAQHLIGPLIGLVGLGHPHFVRPVSVVVVGLFIALMLNHKPSRQRVWSWVRSVGRGARWAFIELPQRLVALETLRRVIDSYVFALLRRFVARPLVVVLSLWLLLRAYAVAHYIPEIAWIGAFFGASAALNSRFGRRVQTDVTDTLGGWWGQLTKRLLPELFRAIVRTSKRVLDAFEKLVHRVEEALRLRATQSVPAKFVRGVAGRLWAAVGYLLQLYVMVLIEPQINPVKHFPVVTVSHKVMLPALPAITSAIESVAIPILGPVVGRAFAYANVLLLPGFFGFVVWELSSNWRLFGANRPKRLKPVAIGHHGEDLPGLLRPGFRSGAIPKHVAKMRRAATEAWERGKRPDLTHERNELAEIEERIHDFFDRELAELLARVGSREIAAIDRTPAIQTVQLGRYRLGLLLAPHEESPLALRLEDRDGLLVATLRRPGFAATLDEAGRAAVADALMGVFQLANVDVLELQKPDETDDRQTIDLRGNTIEWDAWVARWSTRGRQAPVFFGASELAEAIE